MMLRSESGGHISATSRERISYIKQMLGELSQVARAERADLLVYLLEMAYTESNDLLSGKVVPNLNQVKRHEAGRMPVKPAGKVQFE